MNLKKDNGQFRKWYLFVLFLLLIPLLLSCATTGSMYRTEEKNSRGVWHRVQEGQTLWRIAKTYRVTLEEIKEANDIVDVVHVAKGTWILIPNADRILYVQGNVDTLHEKEADLGFMWPLKGEVVNSFGKKENDFLYGIDIKSTRNQDVVATLEGKVVLSGTIRGYGTTIIIEHENNYCSLYSKNIKSLVKEGQLVEKNSVIAKAGTSTSVTGDIVHYELFFKGRPVNPLYYLP